ncbi:CAZyme family CE10 [Penicillium hordei]|uniref:CAZyme family CE10 n=1 Tax=Penicillium hordei TaxID=40994 RepID=A0AAD6EBE2_9EURO|nr:CAZyme family CE10 [Penicillium hordei]KAJ5607878.1 CAZyme family CE10 [Penicillium hordei]
MIFGESSKITGIAESDARRQLQGQMRSAWGLSIADPQHGLKALGWSDYDPELRPLLESVLIIIQACLWDHERLRSAMCNSASANMSQLNIAYARYF